MQLALQASKMLAIVVRRAEEMMNLLITQSLTEGAAASVLY